MLYWQQPGSECVRWARGKVMRIVWGAQQARGRMLHQEDSCSSVQPLVALQERLSSVARYSVLREARNLDLYVKPLHFQMLSFVPALKLWIETSLNLFLQTFLPCTLAEDCFDRKRFSFGFWGVFLMLASKNMERRVTITDLDTFWCLFSKCSDESFLGQVRCF